MAPDLRITLRLTKSKTSLGVAWPEKPSSATVYQVVETKDAREGHVPVAPGITAFGRTYQMQKVSA